MAVIVGPQWFHLKRDMSAGDHIWSSLVHTGKEHKYSLDVYATFGKRSKDFCPLLEYDLLD